MHISCTCTASSRQSETGRSTPTLTYNKTLTACAVFLLFPVLITVHNQNIARKQYLDCMKLNWVRIKLVLACPYSFSWSWWRMRFKNTERKQVSVEYRIFAAEFSHCIFLDRHQSLTHIAEVSNSERRPKLWWKETIHYPTA